MIARIHSAVLDGLDAHPVVVEVDVRPGLPSFTIVGVGDGTARDAYDRIRPALIAQGYEWPMRRITVNVLPSSLRERAPTLDLPIALAILAASDQIPNTGLADTVAVGGLGPGGSITEARGVLPIAETVTAEGHAVLVPATQRAEAALARGARVLPAPTIARAVRQLTDPDTAAAQPLGRSPRPTALSMDDIRGFDEAKAALAEAVAARRSVLLVGPAGCGKTMLARRAMTLMPDLDPVERRAVARIQSAAGLLPADAQIEGRPFRAPHHRTSPIGLLGSFQRPGEVTLAHHGVLYLDEVTAFRAGAVCALRDATRARTVHVHHGDRTRRLPADTLLLAGTTACPCGHAFTARCTCTCTVEDHHSFAERLDRIRGLFDLELLVLPTT